MNKYILMIAGKQLGCAPAALETAVKKSQKLFEISLSRVGFGGRIFFFKLKYLQFWNETVPVQILQWIIAIC